MRAVLLVEAGSGRRLAAAVSVAAPVALSVGSAVADDQLHWPLWVAISAGGASVVAAVLHRLATPTDAALAVSFAVLALCALVVAGEVGRRVGCASGDVLVYRWRWLLAACGGFMAGALAVAGRRGLVWFPVALIAGGAAAVAAIAGLEPCEPDR